MRSLLKRPSQSAPREARRLGKAGKGGSGPLEERRRAFARRSLVGRQPRMPLAALCLGMASPTHALAKEARTHAAAAAAANPTSEQQPTAPPPAERDGVSASAMEAIPGPGSAARPSPEELYRTASELMEEGRHAEACPLFESVHRSTGYAAALLSVGVCRGHLEGYASQLDTFQRVVAKTATPLALFYLGVAHEDNGNLFSALAAFGKCTRRQPGADTLPEKARRHGVAAVLRLREKVPRLALHFAEPSAPDLGVSVDGNPLVTFRQPILLDPGQHSVSVTAGSEVVYERSVTLEPGHQLDLEIPPWRGVTTSESGSQRAPAKAGLDTQPPRRRLLTWSLLGVGSATFVAGTAFGLAARRENRSYRASCRADPPPPDCELLVARGKRLARRADRLMAAGSLVAAAGGLLLFFEGEATSARAATRVGADWAPGRIGLWAAGSF